MPRFSDEQIEQIKQSIPLVALVESRGIVLKRQGKDFIGHCPFHDDKTPSFIITPALNLWNCLGACGMGGSVIDFMMKWEKLNFPEAVALLQQEMGVYEVLPKPLVKKSLPPKPALTLDNYQALLQQAIEHYHQCLLNNDSALAYLEKRGLRDLALIKHFKLGFVDRSFMQTLPSRQSQAGKEIRKQLNIIGLIKNTGNELFYGCVVIPVINQGRVLEVYGRKIAPGCKLRKGATLHLYLPGSHQGVWNVNGLKNQRAIILCEALIDAMSFWVQGFKNVTSSYGVNGFTEEHLAVFKQLRIDAVYLAYDRDTAGDKAAIELAQRLQQSGISSYRIKLPPDTDVNEFVVKQSEPKKALGRLLEQAVPIAMANILPQKTKSQHQDQKHAAKEGHETPPSLAASLPLPELIQAQVNDHEIIITLADRVYRIRGLDKNRNYEQLKINLMIRREEHYHMDTLELYQAKARNQFIKQASIECGVDEKVIKKDLGKILLKLEQLQEQNIQKDDDKKAEVEISEKDREQALALLQSPSLVSGILEDFTSCGVVGEETNKLVGYLACVSRKLEKPLAIIIQSSSAAGKSSLMEAILNLMPEEERVQYSAMTGQSLFYMGETNLKHKILAIAEEEGVEQAAYAMKLLQSEGKLTMASTGKDPVTGNLVTQEYHVEGPVMLFLTTTAIDIDEELMNRCMVLTVNESREQTQLIHQLQRKRRTLEGLMQKVEQEKIVNLHRNAQRLLKPLKVINPYAEQLTFLDDKTRLRRDHEKYLTLIESMALLHQYQRETKTIDCNTQSTRCAHGAGSGQPMEYIEVTLEDIKQANALAHQVLGRSLDELPPQTRRLLTLIYEMAKTDCKNRGIDQEDYRFSRRDIREFSRWGLTQVAVHCQRLEDMEYLICHSGRSGQIMHYELLYRGETQEKFLLGLISNEQLDSNLSEVSDKLSPPNRPQIGVLSPLNRTGENSAKVNGNKGLCASPESFPEKPLIPVKSNGQSKRRVLLTEQVPM